MQTLFTSLNDTYEILRPYAEGGMGKTFLVKSQKNGSAYILKQINLETVQDWKVIELFEREAEILRHLNHPSVPRYVDYFVSEDQKRFHLVQSFIEGPTLRQYIDRQLPLSVELYTTYLRQCLQILDYLHHLVPPVIHRDITPKNIILNEGGASLVDFGAVKAVLQTTESRSETVVGTFGYMPPEQLLGHADTGSDLYSLGMSFIALAAHEEPFRLVDPRTGQIAVTDRLDFLPEHVRRLLSQMIKPSLQDRIRNAGEALRLLDTPSPASEIPSPPDEMEAQKNRTAEIALGIFGILIVVILLIAILNIPKQETTGIDTIALSSESVPDYTVNNISGVKQFAFHPKDSIMAVAGREGVHLCNWSRSEQKKKLPMNKNPQHVPYYNPIDRVAWSKNGKRLAAFSEFNHTVTIWDTAAWDKPSVFDIPKGPFLDFVLTDSAWYIALYQKHDTSVFIFSDKSKRSRPLYSIRTAPILALNLNIEQKLAVSVADSAATLHFLDSPQRIQKIPIDTIAIGAVISPDAKYCIVTTPNKIIVWNIPLQQIRHTIPLREYDSYTYDTPKIFMAVSPDSKRWAFFFKELLHSAVQVYDLDSNRKVGLYTVEIQLFMTLYEDNFLAFSPDGRLLGLYDNNAIKIWKIEKNTK